MLRRLARRIFELFPEEKKGRWDFHLHPDLRRSWGGPMNGQAGRCCLVADLIWRTDPVAILETGSFRGQTTEWLSAFQRPVWTSEFSPRNYGFAKARLEKIKTVHMLKSDSRVALRSVLSGPLTSEVDESLLFYLDAHWEDDLPLAEEIDIIFAHCPKALILVDDFEVADDEGYEFDDYGPGKVLNAAYIAPQVEAYGLSAFYPALPSHRETGARRGCIVLAKKMVWKDVLGASEFLRPAMLGAEDQVS